MATMTTRQRIVFTVNPVKSDGSPGEVEAGSAVVASSDETQMLVALNPTNEHEVFADAVAASGAGQMVRFSYTADADLGSGVVPIIGTSEDTTITVDPRDQTTTFLITAGPAQDKPASPPPGP